MDRIKREKEDLEKAIKKIRKEGVEEIIKTAVKNFTEGLNSIVFYNPENDNFSGETWSSGTYLSPNSRLVEVYRIDGNMIADNSWEIGDIIDDDEYKDLKAAVAKKEKTEDESDIEYMTDYLNPDQLALIGIDFDERFEDYLFWDQQNRYWDDTILGRLGRELAEY